MEFALKSIWKEVTEHDFISGHGFKFQIFFHRHFNLSEYFSLSRDILILKFLFAKIRLKVQHKFLPETNLECYFKSAHGIRSLSVRYQHIFTKPTERLSKLKHNYLISYLVRHYYDCKNPRCSYTYPLFHYKHRICRTGSQNPSARHIQNSV